MMTSSEEHAVTDWTRTEHIGGRRFINLIVDKDSWTPWDEAISNEPPDPSYEAELSHATARSGVDESILTGEARINGRRVALIVSEFAFLAGSIGAEAANRLVVAFERATALGLPVIASPASGGTRMQEGTPAFLQMIRIAGAVASYKSASLPYLTYLRHPTTGGVMASWGSQGHVTFAQPGALLGFLGPRVYSTLYGREFPEGVQVAENLCSLGLIDAVVATEDLRETLDRTLNVLCNPRVLSGSPVQWGSSDPLPALPEVETWDAVVRSRHAERPGARELLNIAASELIHLKGSARSDNPLGMVFAIARFGSTSCVFIGQDRRRQSAVNPLGTKAFVQARQVMTLAESLGLPLVTAIDTPGAELSVSAEESGLASELSRSLNDLITLGTPSVSVLLGQGNGGGAIALLPADRCLAAQHAWLSPLPPEGASAIVHRDVSHAADMARAQKVGAVELAMTGAVDKIVPEIPDAVDEPDTFCRRLGDAIAQELQSLVAVGPGSIADRVARFHDDRVPRAIKT